MFSLLQECNFNLELAIASLPTKFQYLVRLDIEITNELCSDNQIQFINQAGKIIDTTSDEIASEINFLRQCVKFENFVNGLKKEHRKVIFEPKFIKTQEIYISDKSQFGFKGYGFVFRTYFDENQSIYEPNNWDMNITVPLKQGRLISQYRTWYNQSFQSIREKYNQ